MKHFTLSLLLFVSTNLIAQINWQATNGPEGGSFFHLYSDGQFAFAADEFNLYRSSDGLSWEELPFGNLWPIATSPTKLAAGQGFGYNTGPVSSRKFVVSYDQGDSWMEGVMPPTQYGIFTSLAVCSHGIYVPDGAAGKMYRSQDDGLTWDTIAPPGQYCYDVWAYEDRLYADWYSKFWRLAANGTDWEDISPAFGSGDYPYNMYVADSLMFFATENNLWCSKDYGTSWTKTSIPFHNGDDNFARVGNRIYKGAGDTGIMYTDDFGSSWHELPIPNDYSTSDLASINGQLLSGTYNQGILRLDVGNNKLIPANEGLNSAVVYSMNSGAGNLWAACGNGVFAYDLATQQWVDKALLPLPTNHYYENVAISPSGKIATSEWLSEKLYLSDNAGVSWDTVYPFNQLLGWGYVGKINWLGSTLLIENHDWFQGARSTNFGQSWQSVDVPRYIVPFNGKYYGINWITGLVSSSDLGLSWQQEQPPNVLESYFLYATDDRLFLLGANLQTGSVLYSTADGVNWQYSNDGLPSLDVVDPSGENYTGNIWRKAEKYFTHQPSIGFFVSLDTCKTWLPIERNYWRMHSVDTTFFGGGFGGGVHKTGIPQNYGSLSRGLVFSDDNNNGLHEPGEAVLPHLQVRIKEQGAWYPYWFVSTQLDGQYAIGSSPGLVDTIRLTVPSNYVENINPPLHVVSGSGNGRDFGVHFKPNITDVAINGSYAGRPRPGFNLSTYLYYSNEGTIPADGKVSVKLDPNFQFSQADPAPTAIIGTDSLVWDFSQMALFEHHYIQITGKVDSTAMLGSLFKMQGHITPALADYMLANNDFTLCDTVVSAFDPNEKRVSPAQGLTPAQIAAGKELVYTIQFQNTGNYQAERVRITDRLDTALNVNTLRFVAASHPVSTFRLLPGGLLEVIFDPIALPDSNANEAASHGFISFAIQRNKAYNANRKIKNTAAIYFDYNEPIFTNTVLTPLANSTVSTIEPSKLAKSNANLILSPNPSSQQFTVKTEGRLSGAGVLTVLNMNGQVCFQQKVPDWSGTIRVSPPGLRDGTYVVRASSQQGVLFGKIVIVH